MSIIVVRTSSWPNVHVTGLGVKAGTTDQFVPKVFLFDPPGARTLPSVLTTAYQGVPVESEYLPIQFAYGKKKGSGPQATTPADHQKRHRPVPAGVEIGPRNWSRRPTPFDTRWFKSAD